MKILMIDNYDSFTYNLVQLIGKFESNIVVVRNDKITLDDIHEMNPNKIVISPGPGRPDDAGISKKLIQEFYKTIPILGVCLGHQSIGEVFGCKVVNAPTLMHGKVSRIKHNDKGIYEGLPQHFSAGRYHSLTIDPDSIVPELEVTAGTNDGVIMGIKHVEYPLTGIQYHPESVLTTHGSELINNWIKL